MNIYTETTIWYTKFNGFSQIWDGKNVLRLHT